MGSGDEQEKKLNAKLMCGDILVHGIGYKIVWKLRKFYFKRTVFLSCSRSGNE